MLLQPILQEIKRVDITSSGILNLSSNRGQNVGLTIKCNEVNESYIVNFISTKSENYFKHFPCKKSIAVTTTLFKNFHYNSYYFNVSDFPYKQIIKFSEYNLFQFLSNIIINELADLKIDNESIFTYYFYVQVIFLKSFISSYLDSTLLEKIFLDKLMTMIKTFNPDPETFILENENHLKEVAKNILLSKYSFPDESIWMSEWHNLSSSVFKLNDTQILDLSEGYRKYSDLSMFIIEQFGINESLGRSIFTLVNHVGICSEF